MRRITVVGVSLLTAWGIGMLGIKPAKANPNLAECFENPQQDINIVAQVSTSQHTYYWLESFSGDRINTSIVKIDLNQECDRTLGSEQINEYPLSNFLEPKLAQALIESRYATIIQQLGGKSAFVEGLVAELDAGTPHVFFEDEVAVLKKLGIDLERIDSSLFVVGEEGINAHPELRN